MEDMLRISALATAAVLCAAAVRRGAPEIALVISLGAGVGILLLAARGLGQVVEMMVRMAQLARLDIEVVRPVVTTVALSILTRISGEVCRSAGEGGLAAFVESAGTILALVVSLPLMEEVLELMGQLLT